MKLFFKTAAISLIALLTASLTFSIFVTMEYIEQEALLLSMFSMFWFMLYLVEKNREDDKKIIDNQVKAEIEGLKQTVASMQSEINIVNNKVDGLRYVCEKN